MNKQQLKLKINLGLTLLALAVSLTAFLNITYSWFTFTHYQQTDVMEVSAELGLEYELKYFAKNYPSGAETVGYMSPNDALTSGDIITVTDYSTDFLPIASDPTYGVDQMIHVGPRYPGLRFTYALEVTGDFSEDKNISLVLNDYVAAASATCFDTSTLAGITLAQATNVYATAVHGSDDVTAGANAFVTNLSPVDLFTLNSPLGPADIELSSSLLAATGETADKIIFFFTVEYSDASNTYYSYSSTSGSIIYYTPNTLGDSNAYKNLSFAITKLIIHVE